MENIIKMRNLGEGLRLCSAPTDRFKTAKISVNMAVPLKKETASANAVLVYYLHRRCKKYPDMTALNSRLAYLYGARISASVAKIGDVQILRLSMTSIDDRFAIKKESVTEQCGGLLLDMIFEPYTEGGTFSAEAVEREKRLVLERIESEKSDKRGYAKQRCEEIMCGNEPYGINRLGTAEDVEKITPESLYAAWENLLKTAHVQVNIVGSADAEELSEKIKARFAQVKRENLTRPASVRMPAPEKVREVTEKMPINQGKLVMGYRADFDESERAAFKVMTDVFGGGPYSRLFTNVREKMSLCYYCSARLNDDKGIMLIQSGIETENKEKAVAEIKNQLEIVKRGEFTDDELTASKKAFADALGGFGDTPEDYDSWCLQQMLRDRIVTPGELAERVNRVDRAAVVACAKMLAPDTVYMLEGTGEEE